MLLIIVRPEDGLGDELVVIDGRRAWPRDEGCEQPDRRGRDGRQGEELDEVDDAFAAGRVWGGRAYEILQELANRGERRRVGPG